MTLHSTPLPAPDADPFLSPLAQQIKDRFAGEETDRLLALRDGAPGYQVVLWHGLLGAELFCRFREERGGDQREFLREVRRRLTEQPADRSDAPESGDAVQAGREWEQEGGRS